MKWKIVFLLIFSMLLSLSTMTIDAHSRLSHEQKGDLAYKKGDYKKASKEYKKAVKKDPRNAQLHFKLGRAYLKRGKVDDALPELIRATQLNPKHKEAFQWLGDFFMIKKKWDKAAKAFKKLTELSPQSARYHFQYAKVLYKLNKHQDALIHFYKTVLLNPKIEEAYPYLFKLLGMEILKNPENPDTHMVLGRVYELHGQLDEARTQFLLVTKLEPQARDGLLELQKVCHKLKDCKGEISALRALLNFSPQNISLINKIIDTAKECELDSVEIEFLKTRIQLLPGDIGSYARIGTLYKKMGNRNNAYYYFMKYLELCPHCEESPQIKEWCKNEELANPGIKKKYHAFCIFQKGISEFKNGHFEKALTLFQEAEKKFSSFPQLYFHMGQTLEELNKRDEALFAYKKAIKMQPFNTEYWFFLGKALDKEKLFKMAATCFKKIRQLDPNNEQGYLLRAIKMLQSYMSKGIIEKENLLDTIRR